MPGYSVHNPACLIAAPIVAAAAAGLGCDWQTCIAAGIGCASGVVISPDLDLVNTIRIPVIGWLWGAYWWPYRKIVAHRSRFSHMPVLGTLARVAYLMPVMLIAISILPVEIIGAWIAGLMAADLLHAMLDALLLNKS